MFQMPHITLPQGEPGIIGLLLAFRDTEKPLNDLANVLMTRPFVADKSRSRTNCSARVVRQRMFFLHEV